MLFLQKPRNTEFYHTKKSFSFIVISLLILPFSLIYFYMLLYAFMIIYTGDYNEFYWYYTVSVA